MLVRVEGICSRYSPQCSGPAGLWRELDHREALFYWAKCTKAFTDFVGPNNKVPWVTPLLVAMISRVLYLKAMKDWVGQTMKLQRFNRQPAQHGEIEDEPSLPPIPR